MNRILIIGRSGAGKTTFTNELGKRLNHEVVHLDNLFWKPDWVRAYSPEEWERIIADLVANDRWIIDGNYHQTLDIRLRRADAVVYFDIHPLRAMFGGLSRRLFPPKESGDKIERLHEIVSPWRIIVAVMQFPTKEVYRRIRQAGVPNVYIVRNRAEAQSTLEKIVQGTERLSQVQSKY
jgi:adenylate kinase family enzyme